MKRSGSSSSDPSKMLQTGESPRSIERMHVHSRGDDKNNIRGSGSNPSLSGSNHSQKEDSTAQTIQVRTDGSNVVPSTIIGPPRAPSPRDGMVSMSVDPHHPFVKPIDRPHSDHRRAESWSGQYPPICPPSPALSMQGAPLPMGGLIPPFALNTLDPNFISTETRSLLASTAPLSQSSRPFSQQRKRKSGNVRYRSLSSGTPHPGHPGLFAGNQFYDYSNITMPPPPPPPPPRRHQSERFSPRQEFMKLSSGFRGTPPSPSVRKVAVSPQGSKPRSMHSSMRSHSRSNSINGKVTFSPQYNMPPPSPGGMSYGSINQSLIPDFPSEGGEALFMAQKNSARHHIHRESSRMRHMRQQSAQLFMEEVKGHEQPPACRDIVFLLLFLFHIVGIVFLGETYGPGALDSTPDDGTSSTEDEVKLSSSSMIYIAVASGLFAMLASAMALGLMTAIARRFVQVALCLAVMISFAWGTIGTGYSPRTVVPVTGFIALAMSVAYTFIVWERIPFSAANLVTALSGIKANFSTLLVALSFQAITLAYCVYYTFVVAGVYDAIQDGKLSASTKMQYFIYTMLGVSFYWTYNIILNIVQVTTAGMIADWWYHPNDVNVFRSFSKSMFYSLGSICFGSLLVGPVRLIRLLSCFFRPSNDDGSALMCLHEFLNCIQTCVTSCVDGLANHFNSWAFTYVGIYGYGFLEAGSSATELFATRGWTMIVTDDLVPNILLMTSLVIGGATGLFAHLIEYADGNHIISSLGEPGFVSFGIGAVLGLVVTSVLFGIISSSVNAVLVCFAASPVDFENNHPQLSHEMRSAWREVWPGCMDVVDLRVALAGQPSSMGHGNANGIPAEFL